MESRSAHLAGRLRRSHARALRLAQDHTTSQVFGALLNAAELDEAEEQRTIALMALGDLLSTAPPNEALEDSELFRRQNLQWAALNSLTSHFPEGGGPGRSGVISGGLHTSQQSPNREVEPVATGLRPPGNRAPAGARDAAHASNRLAHVTAQLQKRRAGQPHALQLASLRNAVRRAPSPPPPRHRAHPPDPGAPPSLPPHAGLSTKEMNAVIRLHSLSLEDVSHRLGPGASAECSVCMRDLATGSSREDGRDILIGLPCARSHIFHSSCLRPWLQRHTSCPLCRAEVVAHTHMPVTTSSTGFDGEQRGSASAAAEPTSSGPARPSVEHQRSRGLGSLFNHSLRPTPAQSRLAPRSGRPTPHYTYIYPRHPT
ncbi:hypothetical protein CYMTET_28638 [Cymbomonas tetramitiformis]|uniref:RING-type domain-containing protein n=1 Tax=Cymbomonas tetramitiformis TaxID=36881 RepID=A0AAE0FMR0_9CHLO|nr:hypothetical protein CYMTET_28638 [Cymbomonas tetramitiformis]